MNVEYFDLCIVGLGPAGLGAAIRFSRSNSNISIVCLEAGVDIHEKYCSIVNQEACRYVQPCQIISGVGGASVLSGGKVSGLPAGRALYSIIGSVEETELLVGEAFSIYKDFIPLISPNISDDAQKAAFDEYRYKGFNFRYYDAYQYNYRDMLSGYNRMVQVIKNKGIAVRTNSIVTNISKNQSGFKLIVKNGKNKYEIISRRIVIAVGRLGSKLVSKIAAELLLNPEPNQLDVGIRLEFPTPIWPEINSCHNDLKLHFGNARTFCVNKDGYITPYRIGKIFLIEGHTKYGEQSGFSNLALTIRRPPSTDSIEKGIYFNDISKRIISETQGFPLRQRLDDYLDNSNTNKRNYIDLSEDDFGTSIKFWKWGNANNCFPQKEASLIRQACEYFTSRIFKNDDYNKVSVFAPELDYYWPKYYIDNMFQSNEANLYLIGDVCGQFRGILQAFASGIRCADKILRVK